MAVAVDGSGEVVGLLFNWRKLRSSSLTSGCWFLQMAPTASQPMGCEASSVRSRQKVAQLFPLDGEAKKKKGSGNFFLFLIKRFPAMMGELSICPTNRQRRNHESEATSIKTSESGTASVAARTLCRLQSET